MNIITASFNLEKIGMTVEQLDALVSKDPHGYWYEHKESKPWSNHLRDMIQGWTKLGNAKQWDNPLESGTYAIVYDKDGDITNPITVNRTIIFGETTQCGYKRIYTHVGALHGKKTNVTEVWRNRIPLVNESWKCDLQKELDKISIFFRPHSVTDEEFKYDKEHSLAMERQAHAYYWALFGYGTLGNKRDLPNFNLIKECAEYLKSKGYNPKFNRSTVDDNLSKI
jgi:hypothetical protein